MSLGSQQISILICLEFGHIIFLAIEYYLVKKKIQILGLKFYFISVQIFWSQLRR